MGPSIMVAQHEEVGGAPKRRGTLTPGPSPSMRGRMRPPYSSRKARFTLSISGLVK
jgi:hypothetical protein